MRSVRWLVMALCIPLAGGNASAEPAAQPAWPLTVDFKRAPVGAWAEYAVSLGGGPRMTVHWALIARGEDGTTLELTLDGPGAAADRIGGKTVTRMVLAPDPVGLSKPIKRLVVQMADRDPVDVPVDLPGMPGQKFQNPDPKKRVGRATIKVGASALATDHYRDVLPDSTVESWLSAEVPPLGVVRVVSQPRPDAVGSGGKPLPPVTMELVAHGRGARPAITRAPQPWPASKSP